jgi:uncharacterized protein
MGALVDFHSHLLARSFFDTLVARSPLEGPSEEILGRVAAAADIELPPPDTAHLLERWIGEIDRFGVQHLVLGAGLPEEARALAEAAAPWKERISTLVAIDPTAPRAVDRTEELLEEWGLQGALLFPALHGYPLHSPALDAVLAMLEEHGVPVVVHCGLSGIPLYERFGIPLPRTATVANPLDLVAIAQAHPRLPVVIPEFGGGFFRETLMAGRLASNLHVDTGSSHSWIETSPEKLQLADLFERVLGVFGPERILFATGSSTFPRGWRHDRLTAQREALGACGIDETEKARIFGENAAALLRLDR